MWDVGMFHPSSSSTFPGFAPGDDTHNNNNNNNNNNSSNNGLVDEANIVFTNNNTLITPATTTATTTTDAPVGAGSNTEINSTIGVDQGGQELGGGGGGGGAGGAGVMVPKKRILQPRDRSHDRYHRPTSPSRLLSTHNTIWQ